MGPLTCELFGETDNIIISVCVKVIHTVQLLINRKNTNILLNTIIESLKFLKSHAQNIGSNIV